MTGRSADDPAPQGTVLQGLEGLFVEGSLAGIFLAQDERFRYVNPAFLKIFGYGREDLLEKLGPRDLLVPEDRWQAEEIRRRLVQHGEPSLHLDLRCVTWAGAVIDVEALFSSVQHGGRPAVMGTLLDTTERKRAERQAAEGREEIEALYAASSRLLEASDVDGVARHVVEAVESDFGLTHAALWLVAAPGGQVVLAAASGPPAARTEPRTPGLVSGALRAGEILNVSRTPGGDPSGDPGGSELAVPLKLGDQVAGVLFLESPEVGAFRGRDVLLLKAFADRAAAAVEKARLHEALRDRTRQLERFHELALMMVGDPGAVYRAIVGHVIELVRTPYAGVVRFEGDAMRTLATVNPDRQVQAGPCPVRGTPAAAIREDRRPGVFRDVAAAFPSDPWLSQAGMRTYVGSPVVDRRGEVVGVLYAMDTTDRAFGDEELRVLHLLARRAAEEMEEERREAEQEVTQRMLLQSEKMASLGQLVAGVAHEINNPLASILGLAELLGRRPDLPSAAADTAARIVAEAERARGVVKNLLAFARDHEPERRATELADLLQRTIALRETELRVSNIEVVREIAEDLPPTLADTHLLQQALLNLVLNSEQAMREAHGRGRLTLRASRRTGTDPAARAILRVEVEDDGPGIPEALRARVFEPFFTTKAVGQGTGLGLSLTHSIIAQHGGAVWAESSPTGGARFVVELPHDPPPSPASTQAGGAAPAEGAGLRGVRILLADDEEALREVAREVLESEGCVVVEAGDGRTALHAIEAADFDLVITDVKMPDLSGLDLYRSTLELRPELRDRFLFVTGDWVSEQTARFLRETGCAHLEKPYNVDQLLEKARALLGHEPSSPPGE